MAVEIPLTRGFTTIVDDIDADFADYKWHIRSVKRGRYAARQIAKKPDRKVDMHRAILSRILGRELAKGEICDHIDGDTLNNRRSNLRVATNAENLRNQAIRRDNTSGYKGVSYSKTARKYRAQITINGTRVCLGYFTEPELAYEAYVAAAVRQYGAYAHDGTKPLAHLVSQAE
jgi:hypothetical protein